MVFGGTRERPGGLGTDESSSGESLGLGGGGEAGGVPAQVVSLWSLESGGRLG